MAVQSKFSGGMYDLSRLLDTGSFKNRVFSIFLTISAFFSDSRLLFGLKSPLQQRDKERKTKYVLVNRSGFDNLLQDDVFVDYLNKFMALPVFGQRMIYRKKQDKAGLNGQILNGLIRFVQSFVC